MRLLVCGVRGSTPAPGPEFVRYGGNTSCVAVLADEDERPRVVLDAGTGLARLSRALDGAPFVGTILLGHLHWDHTHGLPFFPAGNRADQPGWARQMAARRRKTLIVCRDCHHGIHNGVTRAAGFAERALESDVR